MTAEMTLPSSETTKPQKVLLGSVTALAQSAWMGFALASDVLEQLRLAPSGILRRIQVIRPVRWGTMTGVCTTVPVSRAGVGSSAQ
jgi:hypothetical protein